MQPDAPSPVRAGEELDRAALDAWLASRHPELGSILEISQFPGGYSNLTYLLRTTAGAYVLRRPPFGANIKGGHDMGREFRVLSLLEPVYPLAPRPRAFCGPEEAGGAPFYLMERVEGVILRPGKPPSPPPDVDTMRELSRAAIRLLADLHRLDLEATGLGALGKPEGYTRRQVEGWIGRYARARTDEIADMEAAAGWLMEGMPEDPPPAFVHNDFKYDNLVLNPERLPEIRAVLDWEMSTVGNPLMDLGAALAYWIEPGDPAALRPFNLTYLPGNLTRQEAVDWYAACSGRDVSDMLYYYVFGCFKLGVIAQQIYARFKQGLTRDPRFGALIFAVRACGQQAQRAIRSGSL
ncbi:MAG: phosphotransferase family protein [Bacteroidia bacterium]|nr:phosphotransferase family protein [Bacteroidia bacterium]